VKTVQPETRYARLGEDRLAYQVLGHGPPDLVLTIGSLGSIDLAWEEPGSALFLRRLASFSRLILFDRLGVGNSDPRPLDPLSPWESSAEELVAILDEVGSERDLVVGSDIALEDRGTHPLKGVEGKWQLFAVAVADSLATTSASRPDRCR
jgi:hypothetical protein